MEQFRSWRLQSILKSELAEGNAVFKVSYINSADEPITLFILEEPFKTAIRIDKPPVSFKKITTEPTCFEKAYYDEETKEILACRIPQGVFQQIKDIVLRRKLK